MSGQKRPFRFGGQVVGIAGRTGDAQAVGYPPGPLDGGSQADAVTLGNVDGSNAPSGAHRGADTFAIGLSQQQGWIDLKLQALGASEYKGRVQARHRVDFAETIAAFPMRMEFLLDGARTRG